MNAKRGIIGERKGILMPYPEFCEKMGLPSGYLFVDVDARNGEYIYFMFSEIEEYELKMNLMFREKKSKRIYLRMHLDEFNRRLGTPKEMGNFVGDNSLGPRVSLCFKNEDNRITELYEPIEAHFALANNQDIFVWISRSLWQAEEYFMETK